MTDAARTDAARTGAVRNVPVQRALAAWGRTKEQQTFSDVLRQCAAGELLLDITDSDMHAAGLQPGDRLAVAQQVDAAGKRLLLAYTSNQRLQARRDRADTRSLVQSAPDALAWAMREYDGIAIDAGSPDVCIAYSSEIRSNLTEDPAQNATLKAALLAGEDRAAALEALAADPLLFAGGVQSPGGLRVLRAQDDAGRPVAVAGTSPAELWAWGPAAEVRGARSSVVLRVAMEDGDAGVLVNPAGQSLLLDADECRALLTRAAP